MHDAARLREKTHGGQVRWKLTDPDCLLVTRPKTYPADARDHVVVTVLAVRESVQIEAEVMDEVLAHAVQEIQALTPAVARTPEAARARSRDIQRVSSQLTALREEQRTRRLEATAAMVVAKKASAVAHGERLKEQVRAKTERHVASQKAAFDKMRRCLRIAVRALVHGTPEVALSRIRDIEEGYLSTAFLDREDQ